MLNDTLYRVGMRWKSIEQQICSFGALKRALPGISDHVLGKRLRELQAEALITKHGAVSYCVSERGRARLSIMQQL